MKAFPGRITVDGYSGLFGLSGKCCVSKHKAERAG